MKKILTSILILVFTLLVACSPTPAMPAPTITLNPASSPTTIPTPLPTATPEPKVYSIEVIAFHDWNGNTIHDKEEPFLNGIRVSVGTDECSTDTNGVCTLNANEGDQNVIFITDDAKDSHGNSITELDFLFVEKDIIDPTIGVLLRINNNLSFNASFGQGPLVLPIVGSSIIMPPYNGFNEMLSEGFWHGAYDYEVIGDSEQPVFAPWSGVAVPAPDGTFGDCNQVTIFNDKKGALKRMDFGIALGHLTRVVVDPNQFVEKGDIIGYIDPSIYIGAKEWIACTSLPHLEIGVWGNLKDFTYLEGELITDSEYGWVDPSQLFSKKGTDNPPPLFINLIQAVYINENE